MSALAKILSGPSLSEEEALARLATDMDKLGLEIRPKSTMMPAPPLPKQEVKHQPGASTVTPPQIPAPPPPPGANSPVQGTQPPPQPSGVFTQSRVKLSYSGTLPKVGSDKFELKDEKNLRDFAKNLNKHLPLESLLQRYVDFLSSPQDGKIKYYTVPEIKAKMSIFIPESALMVYDALVRDPNADLNSVFYTLSSKFGSYKKVDIVREQIENILNDTTTPVLDILGQMEVWYNSIIDMPISHVQEEAVYNAMKFLRKRLGAAFAQNVKLAKLAYDVRTLRDLILMISEEFASIIDEGADKELLSKIERNRFHSILTKAGEVEDLHASVKSIVEGFQDSQLNPPHPQLMHASAPPIPLRATNNYNNNGANHYNAAPRFQQHQPHQPQQYQQQHYPNTSPMNNFRPRPPATEQYKNQNCSVPGHSNHSNQDCRYQQTIPCNYSPNHNTHNASECQRRFDHAFGLTKTSGSRFRNNPPPQQFQQQQQQQQQPRDGKQYQQQRGGQQQQHQQQQQQQQQPQRGPPQKQN